MTNQTQTPADEVRVVLVKPGDQLLIGNVDSLDRDQSLALGKALSSVGIDNVIVFQDDITIGVKPAEGGE